MPEIAFEECLREARRTAPRGRVRVFASPGANLGARVEDGCEVAREEVLAAAAAAAWAESARGGVVLAAIEDQPEPAALDFLAHLAPARVLLLAGCADGVGTLVAPGGADGGSRRTATVRLGPPHARARHRREWSPVHLDSLPRAGVPPWPSPAAGGDPVGAVCEALDWLAEREPRLLLAHRVAPWRELREDAPAAAALAQIAGEGRRVVWRLGRGGLGACAQAIANAAARGLAPKLLVDADDLPACDSRLAASAWILSAIDAREAGAMLAWALAHEDCVVLGLGAGTGTGTEIDAPRWDERAPWTPGLGRWLRPGARGTVACSAQGAAAALAACAQADADVGVLQCSSLSPLPAAALASAPRPLWGLETLAPRGFARAVSGCAVDAIAVRDARALAQALASARA